jgi:hypothetical protein
MKDPTLFPTGSLSETFVLFFIYLISFIFSRLADLGNCSLYLFLFCFLFSPLWLWSPYPSFTHTGARLSAGMETGRALIGAARMHLRSREQWKVCASQDLTWRRETFFFFFFLKKRKKTNAWHMNYQHVILTVIYSLKKKSHLEPSMIHISKAT